MHLRELDAFLEEVINVERGRVRSTFKFEERPGLGQIARLHPGPDSDRLAPRASVILGEAIQALRRCLDYLIYEIAFLDSGIEQDDTQFPCDKSSETFRKRLKRDDRGAGDHRCYLVGVDEKHATVVERTQPYPGGQTWVSDLNSLSNPDKHRHLTVTGHRASAHLVVWDADHKAEAEAEDVPGGISLLIREENGMHTKFVVMFHVTLEDGRYVTQTMRDLQERVRSLIDEFRLCFDGQCPH